MKKRSYDATETLGIPVTLIDAVSEDEEGAIEIPHLDMLLATVAVARVLDPAKLVGEELRFLRHVLGCTGTEFAREIDLSDKTVVSRWENGKTRPGAYTEKVIRQLVLNLLGRRAPGVAIGKNPIPGMNIRQRTEPLPMAFVLRARSGPNGRADRRYVPVSRDREARETSKPAPRQTPSLSPPACSRVQ